MPSFSYIWWCWSAEKKQNSPPPVLFTICTLRETTNLEQFAECFHSERFILLLLTHLIIHLDCKCRQKGNDGIMCVIRIEKVRFVHEAYPLLLFFFSRIILKNYSPSSIVQAILIWWTDCTRQWQTFHVIEIEYLFSYNSE